LINPLLQLYSKSEPFEYYVAKTHFYPEINVFVIHFYPEISVLQSHFYPAIIYIILNRIWQNLQTGNFTTSFIKKNKYCGCQLKYLIL